MKVERFEAANERRCVIGMITSRPVLAALAQSWPTNGNGPFPSKWANVVGSWCVKHLKDYDSPPGKAVEGLFASWATSKIARGDEATVATVERFLSSLSEEYEAGSQPPDDSLIDHAASLFDKTGLRRLIETMQGHLDSGDVKAAEQARQDYKRAVQGKARFFGVLQDEDGVRSAIESASQPPLVVYPGALGRFFGDVFSRDNFVAIQAPEKRGKSYVLIDVAWRAMQQRRGTLFFAAGDMSRRQMHRRFAARAAKRPLKAKTIRYPVKITKERVGEGDKFEYHAELQERVYRDPLGYDEALKAYRDHQELYVRSDDPYLELGNYDAGSLDVTTIRGECLRRLDAGHPIDVVVIDYADILKPPDGIQETREKVNSIWTSLRALSSELHCCVVTATQAKRESYTKRTQGMEDASEDKRKLAHVTGLFALNTSQREKAEGLQRWNWLVLREDDYVIDRCVVVAQCLAIANPCVRSTF
jgi:hypothetical protein